MAKRRRASQRAVREPEGRPRRAGRPRRPEPAFEGSVEQRALVWLVAAKLIGLLLIVDTLGVQSFDQPKSFFSRILAAAIGAVVVGSVLRYGTAIVPRSRLHLAVAAFVLANLLAAALAENHYVAVFGEWKRYLGVTFILDMAVLYVAVAVGIRRRRDWALLGAALAAAWTLAALYAVAQRLGLDPVHWADDPRTRPFATIGNADIYGQVLSVSFGAGLGVALFADRRLGRIAGIALAVGSVAIAAIVATRGFALGLGAALLTCGALWVRARGLPRVRPAALVAGAVGLLGALAAVALSPLGQRLRATAVGTGEIGERIAIWRSGFAAFTARPIAGWGPDGLAVAYPAFTVPDSSRILGVNSFLSSAHNWVLQSLATTGIVGTVALVATLVLCVGALGGAFRREPAIVAALLAGLAAYWTDGLVTVGSISVDWVPWTILGGAVALTGTPAATAWGGRRIGSGPRLALVAAFVLPVALGVVPAWVASRDALTAKIAIARGDATASLAAASGAIAADRGRSTYWEIYGTALDLARRWKDAGDAYAEAAARSPYDPTTWESLAVARTRQALSGDLSSGGEAAAIGAARRAVESDTNNAAAEIVLAQLLNAFGHFDAGLVEASRAIRLYSPDLRYDAVAVQAALQMTDKAKARAMLEELVAIRESVDLRSVLGHLAFDLGDREAARLNAIRALELAPDNIEAKEILAKLGP